MLKINLVCVGNLKDKPFEDLCREYTKRLLRFANINIVEIKEKNALENPLKIVESESQNILDIVNAQSSVLMDVNGKQYTSEVFAQFLKNWMQTKSEITFIIGGSYGVSDMLKQKVAQKISMSKLTFPHRMARVMILEQIYRAFTILNNISYHK